MEDSNITLEDCLKCRARCCGHVALEIDKPTCKRDYDNIRWYLMHENVSVFRDHDGDWLLEFKTRCSHLRKDNTCDNYEKRPNVCRNYPPSDQICEFKADDQPHTLLFETAEQFEKWLDKKGCDWSWKKNKAADVMRNTRSPGTRKDGITKRQPNLRNLQ